MRLRVKRGRDAAVRSIGTLHRPRPARCRTGRGVSVCAPDDAAPDDATSRSEMSASREVLSSHRIEQRHAASAGIVEKALSEAYPKHLRSGRLYQSPMNAHRTLRSVLESPDVAGFAGDVTVLLSTGSNFGRHIKTDESHFRRRLKLATNLLLLLNRCRWPNVHDIAPKPCSQCSCRRGSTWARQEPGHRRADARPANVRSTPRLRQVQGRRRRVHGFV